MVAEWRKRLQFDLCWLTVHLRVCLCAVVYPSFWPIKLFKNVLEVLHGSVCYQHDGLVAQAALAQRCSLRSTKQFHFLKQDILLRPSRCRGCFFRGTNLIQDLERFLHCILHFALSFYVKLVNQELKVLQRETHSRKKKLGVT